MNDRTSAEVGAVFVYECEMDVNKSGDEKYRLTVDIKPVTRPS